MAFKRLRSRGTCPYEGLDEVSFLNAVRSARSYFPGRRKSLFILWQTTDGQQRSEAQRE